MNRQKEAQIKCLKLYAILTSFYPLFQGEKFKTMPWSELRHPTNTRIRQTTRLILTSFMIDWMHRRVILPFFPIGIAISVPDIGLILIIIKSMIYILFDATFRLKSKKLYSYPKI